MKQLIERGFENVAVREDGQELIVWYENRVFRYEMTALGVVAAIASAEMQPAQGLTLVPQNLGIPLLSLSAPAETWRRFLAGSESPASFRAGLRVGRALKPREIAHSSYWKADFAARPLLAFELGRPTDTLQYMFAIAPELTLSPFGGSLLTGQIVIRLTDELDPFSSVVSLGRSTLSWAGWIPGSSLVALSGGILSVDRYGFAGEISRLAFGGRLEISGGGDLSGNLKFTDDAILYSSLDKWSAFVAATGRTPGPDLELRGSLARFMEGDLGVRMDLARRFHETTVGFFGIKTENDAVAGLRMTFPLPLRRLPYPRRVRLATVPAFPIVYRNSLGSIGDQVPLFNDTEWVRKGMFPTFVLNNVEDLRTAIRYVGVSE
jgi:hypothetical protein